jgi:hypothetical protein
MSIINVNGKTSEQEGINQTEFTNFKILTDSNGNPLPANAQIISDGTTDRVLLGVQKDGFGTGKDFGFKISQEGYDVKTCADDKLTMSSAFNSFKIVYSDIVSISMPGTANYSKQEDVSFSALGITLPANTVPIVIAYLNWHPGFLWRPIPYLEFSVAGTTDKVIQYFVSEDSISFVATHVTATLVTYNIQYYIITDTLPAI